MKSKLKAIYFEDRAWLNIRQRMEKFPLLFLAPFIVVICLLSISIRRQMSTLNALSLNNTRRAENQIVVFNRVPKVGSQTFMELLRRLALRNNFKFHRDSVQRVETIRLAPYQQEELAEMVSELPTPSGNKNGNLILLSICEKGSNRKLW